MAEVLNDERVAAVLRPFVRSTAPVLRAMRESDPLRLRNRFRGDRGPVDDGDLELGRPQSGESQSGEFAPDGAHHGGTRSGDPHPDDPGFVDKLMRQLDGMQLPGSTTWDGMTVDQRCDWWVKRIGRFFALITSLPNFGGAITSRLPVRNVLGVAGQGLVLSAIAAEHGVHDRGDRVRLLARVLFDRTLPPEVASGEVGGSAAEEDARTEELSGELDVARRERGRPTPKAVIRTVWRMARTLWEIDSELDKRPQGRFYHEWLSAVPVVGIVGGYLGERSALRRVAKRGAKWLRRNRADLRAG